MPTKLSRYCAGLMEAAWLAAVILVPIFFNVYSARIFEPDKIALLRTLALVILAAWVVRLVEEGRPGGKPTRAIWRYPLVIPITALAALFLQSTLLSISPRVSWWGSYQRLQGAYTTFSYLIIFGAIAANLNSRAQVERLLSSAILASLPVCLYGILQRYGIDPVPWSGNVTTRVASNLGNSIFVAAYLIMAFPPTTMRAVAAFTGLFQDREGLWGHFTRASVYTFIAALQVITILFSGSRGPLLGWLAGVFFLFLLLSMLWRKRWLTIGLVGAALAVGGFLVIFNLPDGPLQGLRAVPGIGRLGQLLDAESKTGRVRTLIWQGAAEMVMPHPPLTFPDGRRDRLNLLRPLVGYGPESMFVAYNPFYPPELTQVEKRTATPDRSHNETWDALATTGLLGLVAYLALFAAIFTYGLKWLGLITGPGQRNLFLGLFIGMGAASALFFVLWLGPGYFGVGLPFGMIAGVIVFLILAALAGRGQRPGTMLEGAPAAAAEGAASWRILVLAGLLAAILAHFVEIHFGIAIAATRLYFWVYTALLLVVGYRMPVMEGAGEPSRSTVRPEARVETGFSRTEPTSERGAAPRSKAGGGKKKKRPPGKRSEGLYGGKWPAWSTETLTGGILVAFILSALVYAFFTNVAGGRSAGAIIWNSLVRLRTGEAPISFGVLAMLGITWLAGGIVLAAEGAVQAGRRSWGKALAGILGISALISLLFMLWHSAALAAMLRAQVNSLNALLAMVRRLESLFAGYFLFMLALVFLAGFVLAAGRAGQIRTLAGPGKWIAPLALAAAIWLAAATNLRPVQANIAFKQAETYAQSGTGSAGGRAAVEIYRRAHSLAPAEDYYLLFLGRAYLDQATSADDPAERQSAAREAEAALQQAQSINPLNPDHTANLARLYGTLANLSSGPEEQQALGRTASDFYAQAVQLSPNNARLWDEWAAIFLAAIPQPEEAYPRLETAQKLDPFYDWTYALLAEYYLRQADAEADPNKKQQALEHAEKNYSEALRLAPATDTRLQSNYAIALARARARLGEPEQAIAAYQQAIQLQPENPGRWQIEEEIARNYLELGDPGQALIHAMKALELAPPEQSARLQAWIEEIRSEQ